MRKYCLKNGAHRLAQCRVMISSQFSKTQYLGSTIKKGCLFLKQELQIRFKVGKEYVKVIYCHPAYLIYMQSTSCKMLCWMKLKLESKLPGEISITSDMEMTPPLWQNQRGTKEPLDETERGE